ncbi:MAG: class I SAM-dependent methyltransferase [Candidatus Paceibacterota bacterium]|jgi:ubiquinone/menaquinone biosynthesis C-methylase UbiE
MNEGFLNPQQILKNIPLKEDMIACDFGSGSGGWAIPLAHELKAGMVYAIDVLESAVSALDGKISAQQLFNIKTISGDIEKGVKIKDGYFDLILMTNLLFQVENRDFVMQEAKRVLKPNGMVLIIDWKKDAPVGSKEGRLSIEEAVLLGEKNGFKKEKEIGSGNFHWGLLLRKI